MARKKAEEVAEVEVKPKAKAKKKGNSFVNIVDGVHCISLANRTIHCPNGVAYVTPEELERIKDMGLVK